MQLLAEADMNIDQITASSLQFQEAEGYQHSRDAASRNRVREALNAGLRSLPAWPEPLQTSKGVTMDSDAQPPLQMPMMLPQQQPQQQFQQQSQFVLQPPYPQQLQQEPMFTAEWNGVVGAQPSYPQQQQSYSRHGRQR
jgi:hypothetical protein